MYQIHDRGNSYFNIMSPLVCVLSLTFTFFSLCNSFQPSFYRKCFTGKLVASSTSFPFRRIKETSLDSMSTADEELGRILIAIVNAPSLKSPTDTHQRVRDSLDIEGVLKKAAAEKLEEDPNAFSVKDPVSFFDNLGMTSNDILLSVAVDVDEIKNSVQSKMSGAALTNHVKATLERPVSEYNEYELGNAVADVMDKWYAEELTKEYYLALPANLGKFIPMRNK